MKCNDCGKTFDEPISWIESRGEFWGSPCFETLYGCPYCKSDDIEEETDETDEDEEEE